MFGRAIEPLSLRVRTHDQNFAPLIICNKIVTLPKTNVPSCQIIVPPCQINDPPSQINFPHCQINVPLSNKFSKFLRQNHDPRDIYLNEGHIFMSLFDHVYGPLTPPKTSEETNLIVEWQPALLNFSQL